VTADTKKRLAKLVAIAESLPEAEAVVQGRRGEHRLLRAGKKSFAYYCFDHHGDGRVALWCKSTPGEQARLVAENPRRFFVPPYVGPKGWVGVRLDQRSVDWAEVAFLLRMAFRLSAPRKLVARLE
jgi:phosphoribosylglycinamide formyltransferase-1